MNVSIVDEIHVFFVNKEIISFKKQINEIEEEVKQQLKHDPKDIKALTILEQILYQYNLDYTKAMLLIKHGLKLDERNIDLRLDLVEILIMFELGSQQVCDGILEECYKLDPLYWRYYYIKSILFTEYDDDYGQRRILLQGLEISPNNPWLSAHLSQTYSEINTLHNNALKLIQNMDVKDSYNFELLRRVGYSLTLMKNNEEGDKLFQKAYQLNPKSIRVLSNLATNERLERKDISKSLEYSLQAYKLLPNNSQSLFNMARCYHQLHMKAELIYYYNKCQQIRKYPQIHEFIGFHFIEEEQFDLGIYHAKKALKSYTNDEFLLYKCLFINQLQDEDHEEYEIMLNNFYNLVSMHNEDYNHEILQLNQGVLYIYDLNQI